MENNLIEEIPEGVFNQTENLNVVSLSHNRLDETGMAPMAWVDHRSEPRPGGLAYTQWPGPSPAEPSWSSTSTAIGLFWTWLS